MFFIRLAAVVGCTLALASGLMGAQPSLTTGRFGNLERDETWSGTILLSGDLYVPPGRILTLEAGSTIIPAPGRSNWDLDLVRNIRGATRQITRQGLIDIIVEGTLRMEGRWLSGISVADLQEKRPSSWGGLLAVGKGRIEISRASLYLADTAVALFDESQARINRSKFKSNLAAMEAFHESSLTVEDSTISANPGGIALYNHSRAFVKDCWLRFNSSAVLIADRSKATIQGNILFRNVLALSSLDASSSRIEGNYFIANGTGIRLGQKAQVKKRDNWSLLEQTPLDDEREQTVSAPAL